MKRTWLFIAMLGAALIAACSHDSKPPPTPTRQVKVAVAASVKPVLPELISAFAASRPGITIEPTYGASGTFLAQISGGAPFDLFLSADTSYPQRIVDAGLAIGQVRTYGAGHLTLWTRRDSGIDLSGKGLDILKDPRIKKIAIANPDHAPYGRAAAAALTAANLLELVKPRLVLGESVEQAATFARTGAADIALLARSQATVSPMKEEGLSADVPTSFYQPISHGAVVLKSAKEPQAAQEFLDFITGPKGQEILERAGLGAPGN